MENKEKLVFENFHKVYFEFYERTRGLKNNLDATYFNKVPYCADGASKEVCLKAFELIKEYWEIVNRNKMENNNWCIKLDAENRDIVCKYFNKKYELQLTGYINYYYDMMNNSLYANEPQPFGTEITTEQFIEIIKSEGYEVVFDTDQNKYFILNNGYKSEILGTSTNNPQINNDEFGVIFGSDNKFHKSDLDLESKNKVIKVISKSEKLLEQAAELRKIKNADYSRGNVNPHDFFYSTAKKKGIRPVDVWGVLNEKHQAAFDSFINNGTESEPIEGRVIDMINYLLIFIDNKDNPDFFKNFGNGK